MKKEVKRLISVLMVMVLLVAGSAWAVPLLLGSAAASTVYSAKVSPINPASGEMVTFTVCTDPAATVVQILAPDKKVYAVVDIYAGFKGYRDSDGVRTWTISRDSRLPADQTLTAVSGNIFGVGGTGVPVTRDDDYIPKEKLRISFLYISVRAGETHKLDFSYLPTNATSGSAVWSSTNSNVAAVNANGLVTGKTTGKCLVYVKSEGLSAACLVTVTEGAVTSEPPVTSQPSITSQPSATSQPPVNSEPEEDDHLEPPYPFWIPNLVYQTGNLVYYYGNIYRTRYWTQNDTPPPQNTAQWDLVGPAEWTVPEDPVNYTDSDAKFNKTLSKSQIKETYGTLNPNFTPANAVANIQTLISRADYEARFPYRFGTANWAKEAATPSYYPNYKNMPDYYSYDNLMTAVSELSNIVVRIDTGSYGDCKRVLRLEKDTGKQQRLYQHKDFSPSNIQKTEIIDYGSFLNEGDIINRKRELAAFLANTSHETGGGQLWIDGKSVDENYTGFFWVEEIGYIQGGIGYTTSGLPEYQAVPGKSYHGRGPIQCSYPFNYGQLSDVVYGDKTVLLNNPEKLLADGVLGFKSGIWFWMTPQMPKPSCHQAITKTWVPKSGAANAQYNGQFGLTIIIINGETGKAEGAGSSGRRMKYYRNLLDVMGVPQDEKVDSIGMTMFS